MGTVTAGCAVVTMVSQGACAKSVSHAYTSPHVMIPPEVDGMFQPTRYLDVCLTHTSRESQLILHISHTYVLCTVVNVVPSCFLGGGTLYVRTLTLFLT